MKFMTSTVVSLIPNLPVFWRKTIIISFVIRGGCTMIEVSVVDLTNLKSVFEGLCIIR